MSETGSPAAAVEAINAALAHASVTVAGDPGDLPEVTFPRLGLERRVLGFVTDGIDLDALGPRNTLPALTHSLMRDRATTHPPATHGRLVVDGLTVEQVAQNVLDVLDRLVDAGLLAHDEGVYRVTDAGVTELGS